MTKFILVLSSLGLTILLLLGVFDPSNSIMWLASTTDNFTKLRAALLLVIFVLLVTEPPRNKYLRAFIGLLSVGLVGASIGAFYQNHMQVLDAFLLLSVGISSGISVLERNALDEAQLQEFFSEPATKKHGKRKLVTA